VNFLQNHDQIGNRPLGDRLSLQVDDAAAAAALAVMLLAPMPPLLFMVKNGLEATLSVLLSISGCSCRCRAPGPQARIRDAYGEFGEGVPDPLAETTFRSAVLDWDAREEATATRAARLGSRPARHPAERDRCRTLRDAMFGSARYEHSVLRANWPLGNGSELVLLANCRTRAHLGPSP